MKLGMSINYVGDFHSSVEKVIEYENAGLDIVWVAEAYSIDAVSQVGFLAAKTKKIEIGTGILNVYSRTAAAIAQTAAGCDYVSNGRFILGLGASGPQVIEGFHGVPYEKPMKRISEYIDITRMALKREPLIYSGKTVQIPLPEGTGTGLGKPLKLINHPVRSEIPIWWASLMPLSVKETARSADGWLPVFFVPDEFQKVWGDDLKAGTALRNQDLGKLSIAASATVAIGEEYINDGADRVLDRQRPTTALYWGGMGARDKNFYNTIAQKYGYEEEAIEIQDLYLDGQKDAAAAAVPEDFLQRANLVGPASYVKERLGAWKEAGVNVLNITPVGPDPVATMGTLRQLIEDA
ncbi:MAG: F420-dependent oxidoreductase-like protein [Candidatus Poriferisodalaceae bacterium]|jgi:F420-dependent oxidoreductase-like protein|tara:strand:- start:2767 stop:3819 length:1053 start_codon:yes stop_codon:yes gene_type:complete